ncbi:protein PIGBOS1 [Narcine bancroftii]|uniref:protein PIGBOS1 n=1 Tax=Narcine bancroftii TaxID=1343680 RepID=UPI00383116CA
MLPGRLTFPQMCLAVVLGVAGGIYIYKPLYEQYRLERAKGPRPDPERQCPHCQAAVPAESGSASGPRH